MACSSGVPRVICATRKTSKSSVGRSWSMISDIAPPSRSCGAVLRLRRGVPFDRVALPPGELPNLGLGLGDRDPARLLQRARPGRLHLDRLGEPAFADLKDDQAFHGPTPRPGRLD